MYSYLHNCVLYKVGVDGERLWGEVPRAQIEQDVIQRSRVRDGPSPCDRFGFHFVAVERMDRNVPWADDDLEVDSTGAREARFVTAVVDVFHPAIQRIEGPLYVRLSQPLPAFPPVPLPRATSLNVCVSSAGRLALDRVPNLLRLVIVPRYGGGLEERLQSVEGPFPQSLQRLIVQGGTADMFSRHLPFDQSHPNLVYLSLYAVNARAFRIQAPYLRYFTVRNCPHVSEISLSHTPAECANISSCPELASVSAGPVCEDQPERPRLGGWIDTVLPGPPSLVVADLPRLQSLQLTQDARIRVYDCPALQGHFQQSGERLERDSSSDRDAPGSGDRQQISSAQWTTRQRSQS